MVYNDIENNNDVECFMESYGYFHDSCIKEAKYISGAYVNDDLSMHPINRLRQLSIIFQRQTANPSTIEIVFEGVSHFNMHPVSEDEVCDISSAFFAYSNGNLYWAESDWFDKTDLSHNMNMTFVVAKKAKWRVAENYLGEDAAYVNIDSNVENV